MHRTRNVQIGLLGLGTVGTGVMQALVQNGIVLRERIGCQVEVPHILVRSLEKERDIVTSPGQLTTDPKLILDDPGISVIIEVMGGIEPAKTFILHALRAGKHVITANKELLAKHGAELFEAADKAGVQLLFEASVAGGIPVIRLLQGYFAANRVQSITGILNGTSNYILTKMEQAGQSFADVLADAQLLGYAEADPRSDIDGIDTAYKLAILANLAYDVRVPVHEIQAVGITAILMEDLQFARSFGYAIKLLASAAKTAEGITLTVGPQLLPFEHPLARVNDVYNAVTITADVVGELTFIGKGAGRFPTASAVLEDLTALLRNTGDVLRAARWHDTVNPDNSQTTECYYVRICSFESGSINSAQFVRQFLADHGRILQDTNYVTELGGTLLAFIVQGICEDELEHLRSSIVSKGFVDSSLFIARCSHNSGREQRVIDKSSETDWVIA